jgi:hypothetical protein
VFYLTQGVALGYDELPRWGKNPLFRAGSWMILSLNGSVKMPLFLEWKGKMPISTN